MNRIVIITGLLFLIIACDPNESENPGNSDLVQYTPDQADWTSFSNKPFEGDVNSGHDPDGVGWLTQDWPTWDGNVFDPSTMTKAEFHSALFPNGGDQLIGLREVFYEHKPFTDNRNPTKAEIDEWHRIAINHLRALVGYTSEDRQVKPDHSIFLRAHWGDERKFTTMWDADYPGDEGSAFGPCQNSTNAHCGATFLPN